MRIQRTPALFTCAVLALVSASAAAQGSDFATRCKEWIDKKGYSGDYIEKRTGHRQPGHHSSWKGNLAPADVQKGDVVFSSLSTSTGTGTSVAFVEDVETDAAGRPTAVTVSEWNRGKRQLDAGCFVSDMFGQETRMRMPIDSVLRVWRPGLPLPR
jgi:hypothetical protein